MGALEEFMASLGEVFSKGSSIFNNIGAEATSRTIHAAANPT